jgi:DNA-binding NarL/FixJ family response regulator
VPEEVVTVVLLGGEDALFRRALGERLEGAGMRVSEAGADWGEVERAAAEVNPDVVVAIRARRREPIADLVSRLRDAAPSAPLLLVAGSLAASEAVGALRAGARGYVLKDESPDLIVAAVRAAVAGQATLSAAAAADVVEGLRAAAGVDGVGPELTPRERHVLERLAAGCRNGEIADQLEISVYTVKRHVSHLFAKLGVENRTQAAVEATRRGLL